MVRPACGTGLGAGGVVKAAAEAKSQSVRTAIQTLAVSETAKSIAASRLVSGSNAAILLGTARSSIPQSARLHRLAQELARITGGRLGFLAKRRTASAVPGPVLALFRRQAGMNARTMLESPERLTSCSTFEPRTRLS